MLRHTYRVETLFGKLEETLPAHELALTTISASGAGLTYTFGSIFSSIVNPRFGQ